MPIDRTSLVDYEREEQFIASRTEEGASDMPQLNERDEDEYLRFLGIDFDSLSGKNVLNLGAGMTGLAEKAMCAKGANVVALSPIFANKGLAGEKVRRAYRETIRKKILKCMGLPRTNSPIIVAGVAEEIPLFDNSVDTVMALYSVPLYSTDNQAVCKEIMRVLRPDGNAVLFPVPESLQGELNAILINLEAEDIVFEHVDESTDQVYKNQNTYRLSFKKSKATKPE